MRVGACSDIGKVRQENEDSFYIPSDEDKIKIFLIADGIGGQSHGKLASMMTIDDIIKFLIQNDEKDKGKLLTKCARHANTIVRNFSAQSEEFSNMGTTLVALLLEEYTAHIVHAGDSRCYMIRNGIISQLTIDNSYVQYLLERGAITPKEAVNHPQKNLITKAIGLDEDLEVESETETLKEKDILLLCTDGLTNMLSDEDILHIIQRKKSNMQLAAESLIKKAKENGGTDNITAVLVEV